MTAPHPDLLVAFARDTQVEGWHSLDDAFTRALTTGWSMSAIGIAARIIRSARLVGPTPRATVPWRLDRGGMYDALLAPAGITVPARDPAEQARLDWVMDEHRTFDGKPYGTRSADMPAEYARRIGMLRTDRYVLADLADAWTGPLTEQYGPDQ